MLFIFVSLGLASVAGNSTDLKIHGKPDKLCFLFETFPNNTVRSCYPRLHFDQRHANLHDYLTKSIGFHRRDAATEGLRFWDPGNAENKRFDISITTKSPSHKYTPYIEFGGIYCCSWMDVIVGTHATFQQENNWDNSLSESFCLNQETQFSGSITRFPDSSNQTLQFNVDRNIDDNIWIEVQTKTLFWEETLRLEMKAKRHNFSKLLMYYSESLNGWQGDSLLIQSLAFNKHIRAKSVQRAGSFKSATFKLASTKKISTKKNSSMKAVWMSNFGTHKHFSVNQCSISMGQTKKYDYCLDISLSNSRQYVFLRNYISPVQTNILNLTWKNAHKTFQDASKLVCLLVEYCQNSFLLMTCTNFSQFLGFPGRSYHLMQYTWESIRYIGDIILRYCPKCVLNLLH